MNKSRALILIVSIVFLSFVAYTKFSLPLDTALFSPESLYRGSVETMTIDPKEYYMALNNLKYKGDENDYCDISVVSENDAIPIENVIGNYLPVVYRGEETNYTSLIGKEGEGLFKEKENIIMPISNSNFKNSNLQNSSISDGRNGRHDIEIISGDRILVVLEDVMTWWCHSHNPSIVAQHDVKIGYNSSVESIRGGAVVGVANSSTRIKVYRIKDSYFNNTHKVRDVSDISELEQIHAGKYLAEGVIEVL